MSRTRAAWLLAGALIVGSVAAEMPQTPRGFRDLLPSGDPGPEMVVLPAGRLRMGCDRGDAPRCRRMYRPARDVRFRSPFAMSKYEVTFEDYDRYLAANGRRHEDEARDNGWGRGRRPVIFVTRADALAYAAWLSVATRASYRLPSEAQWEYAARAGDATWPPIDDFPFGRANCQDCGSRWGGERTAPVGSFPPNAWGLHDMEGNVGEMLLDCMHVNYKSLPDDGTARALPIDGAARFMRPRGFGADGEGACRAFAFRGGSWRNPRDPAWRITRIFLRSVAYGAAIGFRVVRDVEANANAGANAHE